jgi:DNA-binding transcriptional regulator of glucitol operon
MLPDLPKLKRDIRKRLDLYLRRQINARHGVFCEAPKHIIQEGDRMRIAREDGTIDESNLEQASAEMSLRAEEIPHMTIKERMAKLDDVADEIVRQQLKHLFQTVKDVCDKTGQSVDARGKTLDADVVLAIIEKMQLDFDDMGHHKEISVVVPPALTEQMKKVLEQIESDPVLRKRYEDIVMRKRIEWRDREASRKLVG